MAIRVSGLKPLGVLDFPAQMKMKHGQVHLFDSLRTLRVTPVEVPALIDAWAFTVRAQKHPPVFSVFSVGPERQPKFQKPNKRQKLRASRYPTHSNAASSCSCGSVQAGTLRLSSTPESSVREGACFNRANLIGVSLAPRFLAKKGLRIICL